MEIEIDINEVEDINIQTMTKKQMALRLNALVKWLRVMYSQITISRKHSRSLVNWLNDLGLANPIRYCSNG